MNDILTYQNLTTDHTNEAEAAWSLLSIWCCRNLFKQNDESQRDAHTIGH